MIWHKSNMTLVAYHLPHIGITSAYVTVVHIKPLYQPKFITINYKCWQIEKQHFPQQHQLNCEGQYFLQT